MLLARAGTGQDWTGSTTLSIGYGTYLMASRSGLVCNRQDPDLYKTNTDPKHWYVFVLWIPIWILLNSDQNLDTKNRMLFNWLEFITYY